MSIVTKLLKIPEAAERLGVPQESLRAMADKHGKTIRIGRAVRLHPDDLGELIDLCRVAPKGRASTGEQSQGGNRSGKSGTPEASQSRPARQAAKRLRERSKDTSRQNPAPVVPFPQRK